MDTVDERGRVHKPRVTTLIHRKYESADVDYATGRKTSSRRSTTVKDEDELTFDDSLQKAKSDTVWCKNSFSDFNESVTKMNDFDVCAADDVDRFSSNDHRRSSGVPANRVPAAAARPRATGRRQETSLSGRQCNATTTMDDIGDTARKVTTMPSGVDRTAKHAAAGQNAVKRERQTDFALSGNFDWDENEKPTANSTKRQHGGVETHADRGEFVRQLLNTRPCGSSKRDILHQPSMDEQSMTHHEFPCGSKRLGLKCHVVQHVRANAREKHFRCPQCDKTFAGTVNLKKHTQRVHAESSRQWNCLQCGKVFSTANSLKRHMPIHTGERPYPCPECEKTFMRCDYRRMHIIRAHTGEKPFKCHLCNKQFALPDDLRQHNRLHVNNELFHCPLCNTSFVSRMNVKRHMLVHTGEKPFRCAECGKTFTQSGNTKAHLRTHTGEKPFQCSDCSRSFACRTTLYRHNMLLHMLQRGSETVTDFDSLSKSTAEVLRTTANHLDHNDYPPDSTEDYHQQQPSPTSGSSQRHLADSCCSPPKHGTYTGCFSGRSKSVAFCDENSQFIESKRQPIKIEYSLDDSAEEKPSFGYAEFVEEDYNIPNADPRFFPSTTAAAVDAFHTATTTTFQCAVDRTSFDGDGKIGENYSDQFSDACSRLWEHSLTDHDCDMKFSECEEDAEKFADFADLSSHCVLPTVRRSVNH